MFSLRTVGVLCAVMGMGATAGADLITGITLEDFDGTLPNTRMDPNKAINGEGLLDNTPALSGTHSATWDQHWYSSIKAGAWITVDLEDNYAVDMIHVWNENENNAGRFRGMKNVEIYVSPDENVANLVKLVTDGSGDFDNETGDFLFPIGEGLATYTGFDLDLSSVTNASLLDNARLIRIMNIDNYGSNGGSGLAEVQFGSVVATPGDANGDGVVDAADYIMIKTHFGGEPAAGDGPGGDIANGPNGPGRDGVVDWYDLQLLAENYAPSDETGVLIPEPATVCLLAFGAISMIRRRRKA